MLRTAPGFGTLAEMRFAPAKLFHAVVITGAALTGCAGPQKPNAAQGPGAATENTTGPRATEAEKTNSCPPGAELPYPPCFLIF